MTYTFKISRRLAISWAAAAAVAAVSACNNSTSGGGTRLTDALEPPPSASAPISISPRNQTVEADDTVRFTAQRLTDGAPVAVTWSASGGTIDAGGAFTSPDAGSFTVRARSASGTATDSTSVHVTAPALASVINMSPAAVTLAAGAKQQFTAQTQPAGRTIYWSATGGTITATGLYTAGNVGGTYRVIARPKSGQSDTSLVTITAPATLSAIDLTPAAVSIFTGGTQQFVAEGVLSDGTRRPEPVTWTASGGTITTAGVFTAGSTPGTYRVIARQASGTLADTATVTVQSSGELVQLILNPASVSLGAGEDRQFSVSGLYSNGQSGVPPVTWSATGGTITQAGLYSAGSNPGTYRVIAAAANGLADTSVVTISATAAPQVTVQAVVLNPSAASTQAGGTIQFTAQALMSDGSYQPLSVTWSATGGTISSGGLYTAGSTAGNGFRVIARQASGTLADTSTVTITAPAATPTAVELTPATATVQSGQTQQFSAVLRMSDGATQPVSVAYSATGGTITSGGLYTAGSTAGTSFRVIATQVGGTLADTSQVTVTVPVTLQKVVVSPKPSSLQAGKTQQFTAQGQMSDGSMQPITVTWSATGGTITSGGLFTAGSTAGNGFRVIATQQGGTKADTSAVTITSATATLMAVELTPATVSLATGATQQFTAQGRMSDNSLQPISVTWSATGGTITTGGLYTAGSGTGTFQVIARQASGTLADTSVVTVVPPASGGGNEPAGFALISDRPFNAKVEALWLDRNAPNDHFSIVQDATAPASPNSVGQALFPAGMTGGVGPISTYLQSTLQAGKTEMYMKFWFKLSANFVGGQTNGVNKVLHIWTGQGTKVVFSAQGAGTAPLTPQMRLQNIDVGTISFNLDPNLSNLKLQRGQWYQIEVLLRLNTPGVQDGHIHWWVNGTKVGQYTNIGYNAPGKRHEWWVVQWNPTYGGTADVVPADQYMWIDHFYVSAK